MRIPLVIAATAMLLAACGRGDDRSGPAAGNEQEASPGNGAAPADSAAPAGPAEAAPPAPPAAGGWDLQSSGEGTALVLLSRSGGTVLRLFCPAGQNRLLVNVPGFRPIGSEERLSVGSDGWVLALVADTRGDRHRGGVTATGEVPDGVKALVTGPVSASYGAQRSGPHPTPPENLARAFIAACDEGAAAARQAASRPAASTHPCMVQDGRLLRGRLRAVGTEPFWAARIEGRCVTYSTPEDQKGTRIWTRLNDGPFGGIWSGALGGKPFALETRGASGACSDGMSDRKYPFEVELVVQGERRRGCAEPL